MMRPDQEMAALGEENSRLRKELATLKAPRKKPEFDLIVGKWDWAIGPAIGLCFVIVMGFFIWDSSSPINCYRVIAPDEPCGT
jgi:hypothetical protein